MDIPVLITLLAISVFFVFIGWQHRQGLSDASSDPENSPAATGGKKRVIDTITLVLSVFVVIGAGEYALIFDLAETAGLMNATFLFGLSVASILIGTVVVRRFKRLTIDRDAWPLRVDSYQNFTTPDYFFVRFGRPSSIIATLITVLAFLGILQGQFVIGGTFISAIAGIPETYSIILMALVVIGYCGLGGFPAMLHTDRHQGILMWASLIIAFVVLIIVAPGSDQSAVPHSELTTSEPEFSASNYLITVYIFILTVAAAFSGPDLWQRASFVASTKVAREGFFTAAVAFFVFAFLINYFAFDALDAAQKHVDAFKNDDGLLVNYVKLITGKLEYATDSPYVWPKWLQIVFSIGLISAFLSTADAAAMLIASAIQNELARGPFAPIGEYSRAMRKAMFATAKDGSESASNDLSTNADPIELSRSKRNMIVAAAVGVTAYVAIEYKEVASVFVGVLGCLAVMGLPTMCSFSSKIGQSTAFLALLAGLVIFLIHFVGTSFGWLPEEYREDHYLLAPLLPGAMLALYTVTLEFIKK